MRFLLVILGILAAFPAWADARLKLTADRPVVIVVNLVPHPVGDAKPVNVDFDKGKEGTQRITVRNLAGQQLYQGTVVVNAGQVVTVAWRDRNFEVVGRSLLKTSTRFNRGGGSRRKAGHRDLDALAADGDANAGDDLLSLAASATGPEPDGDAPDDGSGAPTEDAIPAEVAPSESAPPPGDSTPSRSGKGTGQQVLAKDLSAGAAATAQVKLVPRSQSWANVWVGDEKVWEYRGEGDAMQLTLPAGTHTLSFKDFRDRDDWGTGTLTVTAGSDAEVHFSMSQPVEARGGDWAPTP